MPRSMNGSVTDQCKQYYLSKMSFNVVVLRAKREVYFTGNILQTEPVSGEQTVLLDVSL